MKIQSSQIDRAAIQLIMSNVSPDRLSIRRHVDNMNVGLCLDDNMIFVSAVSQIGLTFHFIPLWIKEWSLLNEGRG